MSEEVPFVHSRHRPFVPRGGFDANWVQSETPDGESGHLQSFSDATDKQKCRWMEFLPQQGVTTMRSMLRTHRSVRLAFYNYHRYPHDRATTPNID
jgi:hypothetical protein